MGRLVAETCSRRDDKKVIIEEIIWLIQIAINVYWWQREKILAPNLWAIQIFYNTVTTSDRGWVW